MTDHSLDHAITLDSFNPGDYCIIDIRDHHSYQEGHLKGAIHLDDLQAIKDFALQCPDQKVLLQCWHGNTARRYADLLHGMGLENIYFLKANIEDFKAHGLEMLGG
ncbi:rhodanese-like domain-containing protein [Helicobacter bizzozeronii]|uniref:rhodanese-like domain-containing protein n=1 Tax=Helicobacter bizzozeronii TaxID=56877 RepID=UPI000CF02BA6|nr:rhodanese-like domain-containing protein [Helicobacter bizzozeronii]